MPQQPYNPLDKIHLAESIAKAVLERPVEPLAIIREMPPFEGAGIYVLYYNGSFRAYREISGGEKPIYVGKAVPRGSRRGKKQTLEEPPGTALYSRLCEHADSVDVGAHLNLNDFSCRYLIVDQVFIPLGESLLINRFEPIWNLQLAGFGNHDPGSGRYNQQRSAWDTVHPGRNWAMKCKPNKKANAILKKWGGGPEPITEEVPTAAEPGESSGTPQCPNSPPRVS